MNRDGSESDGLKELLTELAAEEREERGAGAISDDDLLAYRAGELDEERSELVMRVLATEPEWADRMLEIAQFEEAEAETQVEPEELEREWRTLEATMEAPDGRLLPFRRRIARRPLSSVAAAALVGLALALLSMTWLQEPAGPLGDDNVHEFRLVAHDDTSRSGPEKVEKIATEADWLKITLGLPTTRRNVRWEGFRIELRDPEDDELLNEATLKATSRLMVEWLLPLDSLKAGTLYEIRLLSADSSELVIEQEFRFVLEGPAL